MLIPKMLIPFPSYAPVWVTSVKVFPDIITEIISEPPPGWVEHHRSALRSKHNSTSEGCAHDGNGEYSGGSRDSQGHGLSHDPGNNPRHPHPTGYVFSKRKIYNAPYRKYWVIRYGEPLQSPPPEVDASDCPGGPAVFVNIVPHGGRQIWLWDTGRRMWEAVPIGHIVDMDVRRRLALNAKHVPVFIALRSDREKGEMENTRTYTYTHTQFVPYVAPLP